MMPCVPLLPLPPRMEPALFLRRPPTSGVMMGLAAVPVMVMGIPLEAALEVREPPAEVRAERMPTAAPPRPRLVSSFMVRRKLRAPEGATVPLPVAVPRAGRAA